MDKIISAISKDGSVVCHAIDSTNMVRRAEYLHQTSATVTAALGRLLTAASLMGSQLKDEKASISLRIKADGPAGAIVAVSDYQGNTRGYVENPIVEIPENQHGKLDVSGAIGKNGTLNVIRDLGFGEPYAGAIELVSGEVAEDITAYYAQSEQVPTACALGVLVNTDLTVLNAGGFIAHLLPGATEESITQLEENVANIESVTTMLSEGKTPEDIMNIVMSGLEPNIINTSEVAYVCNCSRERVEKALISIGREDLQALKEEEEIVEVACHFCNKKYKFNSEEVQHLIDTAKR